MMNKKLTAFVLVLMVFGPFGSAFGEQKSNTMSRWDANTLPGVAPLDNDTYTRVCGSCHFPYQPGLLPALSWEKLMIELPAHFSTKLDIPSASVHEVLNYLLNNAAGRVDYEVSKKIMGTSKPGEIPTRVTATPYFVERHKAVITPTATGTTTGKNLSDCAACHSQAAEGTYK